MTRAQAPKTAAGLLVVLSGPSGVGKGTVVAAAMSRRNPVARRLRRSISVTTRPRRPDERHGHDYFFCTPAEFDRKVGEGDLLEHATYLHHHYGTPSAWVDEQLQAGHHVILEIEVKGALQVKRSRPDAVLVYLLPPSWSALRRRLRDRRSESEEIQEQRLAVAREELLQVREYRYCIINDRVDEAARQLLAIIEAEPWRVDRWDPAAWIGENHG